MTTSPSTAGTATSTGSGTRSTAETAAATEDHFAADQEPPAPGEGLRDFNASAILSRQLDTDVGNLALHRGGHEMMAAGFRAQRGRAGSG